MDNSEGYARLSPREREIVKSVADGKRAKEIAYELRISEYTVRNHLRRAYCTLGVHSAHDLTYIRLSASPSEPQNIW